MTGWEIDELVTSLKEAHSGNSAVIVDFVEAYPLAAVNADYTKMVILRKYNVTGDEQEQNIMNCPPETEQYQNGIACINIEDDMISSTYMPIPNRHNYKSIDIEGDVVSITTDQFTTITNMNELFRKGFLLEGHDKIEEAFNSLKNERLQKREKPKVTLRSFCDPVLGELNYKEDYEQYTGQIKLDGKSVDVAIYFVPEAELEQLVQKLKDFLESEAMKEAIEQMITEMYALKLEAWMDDDEDEDDDDDDDDEEDDNEDFKMTRAVFSSVLSLQLVTVYEEGSLSLLYDDGDMFWGHQIDINIDESGCYKTATLIG